MHLLNIYSAIIQSPRGKILLNHYLINDLEQCLKRMNRSNEFEKLTEYQHLQIYKLIYSKK